MATAQSTTVWDQEFDAEHLKHNVTKAYEFRSMTLSIAGSVAGVLGLQNLVGFAFFAASVVFVNLIFIFVCAQGKPELYFSLYPSPVLTTALEKLIPSKAAQLRKPAAPHTKIFRLGVWIVWQGLQENLLSFILWWTFWHGIVHVYD